MESEIKLQDAKRNGGSVELMSDSGNSIHPEVDIIETDDSLVFHVDLPGVSAGGAKVEVDENHILALRAKSSFQEPAGLVMRQARIGDYYRAFQLGVEYDQTRISARWRDGVLILTIPKKAEFKAQRIEIDA